MKTIQLLILCCFVSFNLNFTHVEKCNDYPTLTWRMDIHDAETKESIKGMTCIREVFYEHVRCQPEFSANHRVKWLSQSLEDKTLSKEKKIELEQRYKEAKIELELYKKKNLIPWKDTITVDTVVTWTMRNPVRKYQLTLIHPDYKTLIVKDSFDVCAMSVGSVHGMDKKSMGDRR